MLTNTTMATKKTTKTKITKKDLDQNPVMAEKGLKVGDEVEVVTPAKGKNVTMVLFTLKDGKHREFSEEMHGKNFKEIAAEFEETNKLQITARADV